MGTTLDREMILSPYKWPLLYLPLKRPSKTGSGFPEIGLLRTVCSKPEVDFIVDENMSIYGTPLGEVIRHTYKGVDALLADGWVVD